MLKAFLQGGPKDGERINVTRFLQFLQFPVHPPVPIATGPPNLKEIKKGEYQIALYKLCVPLFGMCEHWQMADYQYVEEK